MEQTYFVPETMPLWNVLEEMRKRRLHMAIVVDEYGGTAGIVTLEVCLDYTPQHYKLHA
jgi:putative hemolysin